MKGEKVRPGRAIDVSAHKGYREPPTSKNWRVGQGMPRPEIANPFADPNSPLRKAKKVYEFGF